MALEPIIHIQQEAREYQAKVMLGVLVAPTQVIILAAAAVVKGALAQMGSNMLGRMVVLVELQA